MGVQSTIVHLHHNNARNTNELIGVIDRFIDQESMYDLEWDDFISWENSNNNVELIRQKIGKFEHLLFSKNQDKIRQYANIVIEERNNAAAILGIKARPELPPDWTFRNTRKTEG